eukprot:2960732-Rhodomonas_salina.1
MKAHFTYNWNFELLRYGAKLLDGQYVGARKPLFWSKQMIDDSVQKCWQGTLKGTELPWVECCLLVFGAKRVTTLEYREIGTDHPQLDTMAPAEFQSRFLRGNLNRTQFDAAVRSCARKVQFISSRLSARSTCTKYQVEPHRWVSLRRGRLEKGRRKSSF